MKVLIVYSNNHNKLSPFVKEQVEALEKFDITFDYFGIKGKGIKGYLSNLLKYYKKVSAFKPDLIHAHNGHSGLFANLQFVLPVVTTFHGSDVHQKSDLKYSKICAFLSKKNIVVNQKMKEILNNKDSFVIPCGVDTEMFKLIDKSEARRKMNLLEDKKYILFASGFSNKIKNYPLANKAWQILNNEDVIMLEFANYSRKESALLMNAVDVALMTSFAEGSPQFVKEAMACGTPIVSTDVGDVKNVFGDTQGCFLSSFDPQSVADNLIEALLFAQKNKQTKGRERLFEINLHNQIIAEQIFKIYKKVATKD